MHMKLQSMSQAQWVVSGSPVIQTGLILLCCYPSPWEPLKLSVTNPLSLWKAKQSPGAAAVRADFINPAAGGRRSTNGLSDAPVYSTWMHLTKHNWAKCHFSTNQTLNRQAQLFFTLLGFISLFATAVFAQNLARAIPSPVSATTWPTWALHSEPTVLPWHRGSDEADLL